MAKKRNRLIAVAEPAGDSERPDRAVWRRAWVEGSRGWSAEAQAIAATAPLEEVGPLMLGLARAGRLSARPAGEEAEDDIVDRLFARARELDTKAWVERDRLEAERGVNPDQLGQKPRNQIERRMRDRRAYSVCLAYDEWTRGGSSAIAAALAELEDRTRH